MTRQKVTLKARHIHAGVEYPAGESIQVAASERAWLESAGLVDPAPAAEKAAGTGDSVSRKPGRVRDRQSKE